MSTIRNESAAYAELARACVERERFARALASFARPAPIRTRSRSMGPVFLAQCFACVAAALVVIL